MEVLKVKCKRKSPYQVAIEISFCWCAAHYHMRSTSRGVVRDPITLHQRKLGWARGIGRLWLDSFLTWLGKNWKMMNMRLDDDRAPPHTAPPPPAPPPPPSLGGVRVCLFARPPWGQHRGTRLIRPMRWCSLMWVPTIKDAPHLTASTRRHFMQYFYSVVTSLLRRPLSYFWIVLTTHYRFT